MSPRWPLSGRRLRPALTTVITFAGLLLAAGPARAAALPAGTPFNANNPEVLVVQGQPTQLNAAIETNGSLAFTKIGSATYYYNGVGYNPNDGYLYGVALGSTGSVTQGHVVRIDSTGAVVDTGVSAGLSGNGNIGAWDSDTNLMYFGTATGGTSLVEYNPSTNAMVGTLSLTGGTLQAYDLTYDKGYFWGLYLNGSTPTIQRINASTGAVTTLAQTTAMFPNFTTGPAGAAWTYGNGNLGFQDNTSGTVYQLSITNPSAATPTFALVASQGGPNNAQNDGANVPGGTTNMTISTTAPSTATPGSTVTYTYTITNNGSGNSSGYVVSDTLPSSLTNVTTTSSNCTVSSNTLTCEGNPLNSNQSATVSVSGTVPSPFTSPIANTATVTPNEAQTNTSGNTTTSTIQPAPPQLTVANTSASSGTPGSALSWTVTPTVAAGGGNESQPITVTDTLGSGVTLSATPSGTGWTCTGAAGASSATCTYTPGSAIAPGTALNPITVPTTIAPGARTSATTTAVVSSSDNANSASASTKATTVALTPSVDDALTITAPSSAVDGQPAAFTATVTNNGPSTANNVTASISVPNGATYSSGPAGCTLSGSTVTCALGSITPSSSASAVLYFTPTAPAALAVTGSVTQTETDSNTSNNTATSAAVTVARATDLAVTGTSSPTSVTPGGAITDTFTIKNNGPDASTGFHLTDTLPANVSNAATSTTNCTISSGVLTCSGTALASGATTTVVVTFNAPTTFTSALTNTATVTPNESDPNSSNNSATITTNPSGPLLSLTDTTPSSSATPGTTVTYTLTGTVSATAPGESQPVTITEALPSGETVASAPSGTGWNCSATTVGSSSVSCTYTPSTTLAPGSNLPALSVPTAIAPGARTSATATAAITSTDNANSGAASSASNTVTLTPSVDDSVTVTPPSSASVSSPVVFAVTAANAGPSTATGVSVSVPVPSNATFVPGSSSSACSLSNGNVVCTQATLTPGSSQSFNVAFTTPNAGGLQVGATVSQNETDSRTSNNSATGTATVTRNADLAVTGTGTGTANPGGAITDTFTVTNNGPDGSTGFTFSAPLPTGATNASSATSICSITSGGALSCSGGALASGATTTISVSFNAPSPLRAPIAVTGTVAGANNDPTSGNNSATVTTSPSGPLLSLSAAASPSSGAVPGNQLTYTLTGQVSTTGPGESAPVTITETLPSSVTVASTPTGTGWNCSATTVGSSSVSCVYTPSSSIASGASLPALTVVTNIAPAARGSVAATAAISSSDNASSPTASAASSNVSLTPSVDDSVTVTPPSSASVSSPVVFAVAIANAGPSTATGVNVSMQVPSGATFAANSSSSACTLSNTTVTCTQGTLGPITGQSFNVAFTTPNAGGLQVGATVSQNETDSQTSNNSATGTATVTRNSDLSVTGAETSRTTPGGAISATFTVRNNGPDDSTGFTFSDPLPAGVTNAATSTSPCTITSGPTLSCTEGALASGSTTTIAVTFNAPSPFRAAIASTGTVAGVNNDPTSGNNSVTLTTSPSGPLLSLTASTSPSGTAVPGTTLTYTLIGQVSSTGPGESSPVTITEPLPAGVTVASAPTGNGWDCSATTVGSSNVSCTYTPNPSVASGASLPALTVVTNIAPSARGTNGSASATATIASSDNANNASASSASTSVTLSPSVDDSVTVNPPSAAIATNAAGVYAVAVANAGPSTATNVVVTVPVPSGASFVQSSSSPACLLNNAGTNVLCTLSSLAPGNANATTLNVAFSTPTPGSLTVAASVNQTETDSNISNNSGSGVDTVAAGPTLSVTTSANANAAPGAGLNYVVGVQVVSGTSEEQPVTVSQTLPSGVTVSALPSGTGWNCGNTTVGSSSVSCTYTPSASAPVAPGSGLPTLTIPAAIDPGARGSLTATTTASSSDNQGGTNGTTSTTTTTALTPSVSDSVSVSAPSSATVGTPVTVTVTATNAGPSTANGVTVTVPVPANATYASGPAGCALNAAGTAVVCTVGTLAPGSAHAQSFALKFTPTKSGTLTVAASIAQTETNAAAGGGAGSASTPVSTSGGSGSASADLAVTVTPPATTPTVGNPATFTIRATNNGTAADPGVVVSIPVPSGVTVQSVSDGCTVSGSTIQCSAGTLQAGQSSSFQVVVVPTATGTVTLSATAQGTLPNSDPARATATSSAPVRLATGAGRRWLGVKITTRKLARFGWKTSIRATVSNNGAYLAKNVTVKIHLPARTVLRHKLKGCKVHGRTMSCRIGYLKGHQKVRRILLVRLRHRGYQRPSALARGNRFGIAAAARARTRVFVWVRAHLSLHVFFPGSVIPVGRPERIKFSVRVTNHVTAPNVLVCNTVPLHAKILSARGLKVRGRQVCATVALLGSRAAFYSVLVRFPASLSPRPVQDTALATGLTVRRVNVARSVPVR